MTETTISAALSIEGVLREVRAVGKDSRNTTQGFNFRGIDAVMNAVNPALRKVGGFIVPNVVEREYVQAGTTKNGTPIVSCRVTVVYQWHGTDGGDPIAGRVVAEANDMADKATAKAMSVAYRTFLLQTLMLPTDEPDPDESYIEPVQGPQRAWRQEAEALAQAGDVDGLRSLWMDARSAQAGQSVLDGISQLSASVKEVTADVGTEQAE